MVTNSEEEEGRSGSAEPTRSESSTSESPTSESSTQPLPHSDGASDEDHQELLRQREELALLHSQLDTRGRRQRRITVVRQIAAALLVLIAALGFTVSVIGVWAGRTVLDTDRWVETVGPLSESPAVQAAVSTYMTDQIFSTLNVEQRVREALPPRGAFLATPLSAQVRGLVKDSVSKVLASPQFVQLWPQMNRVAHRQVMATLNEDSNVIRSNGDTVTVNLLPVVNEVLGRLEQQAPTLFGKTLNLPTITNGQIPEGLQAKIESALGVTLPANFAAIPIYHGDELTVAQKAVVQVKRGLGALVVGSVLALALALWVSPRRRRTTLQFGVWLVIFVFAMTSLVRAIRAQLIDQVPAGVMRQGVDAAVQIVFATLRERGTQLIWLGIVIAVVAYLVGPGRGAVAVRRGAVQAWQFLGVHARRYAAVAKAEGPDFARAHLDPLRIGGAVVAGVLLLVFSSWTGLLVIAVILGLYELLLTAVAAAGHKPTVAAAGHEPTGGQGSPSGPDAAQTSRSPGAAV